MTETRFADRPLDRGWLWALIFSGFFGLVFVAAVFFPEPQIMLGIDGNYGFRVARDQAIDAGLDGWTRPYWFGLREHFGVQTFIPFLRILEPGWAMPLMCAWTWAVAIFFTAILLRRFGLGWIPSVFGGVAFGLTPHYATLVFPSHLTVVTSVAYVPMTLYLMVRAMASEESVTARLASAIGAGATWGMLLNDDPQRGLYFSLLFLVFALFEVAPQLRSGSDERHLRPRLVMGGLLVVVCATVALGVFAFHLDQWLGSRYVGGGRPGVHGVSNPTADQRWVFSTGWSHHPSELIDAVASGYHGEISGDPVRPYVGRKPVSHTSDAIGVIVVVIAFFGGTFAWRSDRRVRFFAVAAVVATLLAMGGFWPGKPLYWLWYQLPGMDLFRTPMKFMAVTSFALAVLAAFGLEALVRGVSQSDRPRLERARVAMLAIVGVAAAWTAATVWVPGVGDFGLAGEASGRGVPGAVAHGLRVEALVWMTSISAAVAVFVAAGHFYRGRRSSAMIVGCGLIGLLVFDLYRINSFYLERTLVGESAFFRPTELSRFLAEHRDRGRTVLSLKVVLNGAMIPLSLAGERGEFVTYMAPYFDLPVFENVPQSRRSGEDQAVFAALLPAPSADRPIDGDAVFDLVSGQRGLWRMADVRYIVTDGFLHFGESRVFPVGDVLRRHPELRRIGAMRGWRGQPLEIFEFIDAPGSAVFHSNWRAVGSPEEAIAVLGDPAFDPGVDAVVEGAPVGLGDGLAEAEIRVVAQDQDRVLVGADVSGPGLLAQSIRYDGWWRVKVNGVERPVVRTQRLLPGVFLDEGTHTVEWIYRPEMPLRTFSRAVLMVAILVAAIGLFGSRRPLGDNE